MKVLINTGNINILNSMTTGKNQATGSKIPEKLLNGPEAHHEL